MRLPLPGPKNLLHAAAALGNGVGDAIDLLPRLVTMVDQAEMLLGRVGQLVDRIESTLDRADTLISDVAATDHAAREVVSSVETTASRTGTLMELYDDALRRLAPSIQAFAETLHPEEVHALISLVDRLPLLLTHLDEDVLPILTTLDQVAPDLHQLLEIAQDLQVAIGGLPGMGWVRKRAEKEEEEAEQRAQETESVTGKPVGTPKS